MGYSCSFRLLGMSLPHILYKGFVMDKHSVIRANMFLFLLFLVSCGGGRSDNRAPDTPRPTLMPSIPSTLPTMVPAPIPGVTPRPVETPVSSEKISIHFLSAQKVPSESIVVSCDNLSEEVVQLSKPPINLGVFVSQKVRDFSSVWLSLGGEYTDQQGTETTMQPTQLYKQTLNVITFDLQDWNNNPSLEKRDVSAATLLNECTVISAFDYFTQDLVLSIDEQLKNWVSDSAIANQINYDIETKESIKYLFGRLDLGYGLYAKGGIHLDHRQGIVGSSTNYSQFSLHWLFTQKLEEIPSVVAPEDIQQRPIKHWFDSCSLISLRVASNSLFVDASPWIQNRPADCTDIPLFIGGASAVIPSNQSESFVDFLNSADRLHNMMYVLGLSDQKIPCEELDSISLNGCSQPIVVEFEDYLVAFMRTDSDLFFEINFSGFVVKQYRLEAQSGDVIEISSRLIK